MKYDEKELTEQLSHPETQRKAFGMLVSQYSETLYWKIRRIVLTHDDANDVLQNAFLKAWSNLDDFQNKSKISTWLYRIAINEALDFVRREKNKLSADADISLANRLMADEYFDGDEAQALLQEAYEVQRNQQTAQHFGRSTQGKLSYCCSENF